MHLDVHWWCRSHLNTNNSLSLQSDNLLFPSKSKIRSALCSDTSNSRNVQPLGKCPNLGHTTLQCPLNNILKRHLLLSPKTRYWNPLWNLFHNIFSSCWYQLILELLALNCISILIQPLRYQYRKTGTWIRINCIRIRVNKIKKLISKHPLRVKKNFSFSSLNLNLKD